VETLVCHLLRGAAPQVVEPAPGLAYPREVEAVYHRVQDVRCGRDELTQLGDRVTYVAVGRVELLGLGDETLLLVPGLVRPGRVERTPAAHRARLSWMLPVELQRPLQQVRYRPRPCGRRARQLADAPQAVAHPRGD